MNASWLSSWAASRAVNWAPDRTLIRLAVARALADSSSTTSIFGASSGPKWAVTPADRISATSVAEWSRVASRDSPTRSRSANTVCTRSASSYGVVGS
jgi:hypothetical protein